jgi:hypothetical protein
MLHPSPRQEELGATGHAHETPSVSLGVTATQRHLIWKSTSVTVAAVCVADYRSARNTRSARVGSLSTRL